MATLLEDLALRLLLPPVDEGKTIGNTYSWRINCFQHLYEKHLRDQRVYSEIFKTPSNKPGELPYEWRLDFRPKGTATYPEYLALFVWAFKNKDEAANNVRSRKAGFKFRMHRIEKDPITGFERFTMLRDEYKLSKDFEFDTGIGGWGYNDLVLIDSIWPTGAAKTTDVDIMFTVTIFNDEGTSPKELSAGETSLDAPYFNNPEWSDIQFTFPNGSRLYGHKVIIARRSEYYKNILRAHNGPTMAINDFGYNVFRALLYFIYNSKIDESLSSDQLAEFYKAASSRLDHSFVQLISTNMSTNIRHDNWISLLMLGFKSEDYYLQSRALDFATKNWAAEVSGEAIKQIMNFGGVKMLERLFIAKNIGIHAVHYNGHLQK